VTIHDSRTAQDVAVAAYLESLPSYECTGVLADPTLDRMRVLLDGLGDPHRWFRSIHVTGTNGKGSVTTTTAALLAAHGLSVGAYTSPHVDRLCERVAVQGVPVDEAAMDHAVGLVRSTADALGMAPTWFEVVTAAGFWLFAEHRVDVAVVEVGMLGRWDATNVIAGDVAVVTNVELDHTEFAGPTRADIAREKAGIVNAGATLILGERDPALRPLFAATRPGRTLTAGHELRLTRRRATAAGQLVDLHTARGSYLDVAIGALGSHQCANALLAVAAAEEFLEGSLEHTRVEQVLADVRLPGRGEIVLHEPLIIVDGAHNPAALAALRALLDERSTMPGPIVLVCGVLDGRDLAPALRAFAADVDVVIATEPASSRAVPAAALAAALRPAATAVRVEPDPGRAVTMATSIAGRAGTVAVTGSLHLLAAARRAVQSGDQS
jgi:dihydrofolate synthase/folylpolyglutamate synthase